MLVAFVKVLWPRLRFGGRAPLPRTRMRTLPNGLPRTIPGGAVRTLPE